jgi:hypothetical protein
MCRFASVALRMRRSRVGSRAPPLPLTEHYRVKARCSTTNRFAVLTNNWLKSHENRTSIGSFQKRQEPRSASRRYRSTFRGDFSALSLSYSAWGPVMTRWWEVEVRHVSSSGVRSSPNCFWQPEWVARKGARFASSIWPRIECGHGWPHKAPATRAGEARMAEGEVPIFDSGLLSSEVNPRGKKRAVIRTYPQAAGVK